ncbi:TPA: hypothetical protein N0F65_009839, partial [Lagenidium giganteum]
PWKDAVFRRLSAAGGHPNIVHFHLRESRTLLQKVLEYCHAGDLFIILMRSPKQRFSQQHSWTYFVQIVRAITVVTSRIGTCRAAERRRSVQAVRLWAELHAQQRTSGQAHLASAVCPAFRILCTHGCRAILESWRMLDVCSTSMQLMMSRLLQPDPALRFDSMDAILQKVRWIPRSDKVSKGAIVSSFSVVKKGLCKQTKNTSQMLRFTSINNWLRNGDIKKGSTFPSDSDALHAIQDLALALKKSVHVAERSGVHHPVECISKSGPYFVVRFVDGSYGVWYVSSCHHEHINCALMPKLTCRQIQQLPAFSAAMTAMCKELMSDVYKRSVQADEWQRQGYMVTPAAYKLLQTQTSLSPDDICYVTKRSLVKATEHEVSLKEPKCSCTFMDQQGIPCRHL